MKKRSDYSIKSLVPLFIISLCIGVGLVIGYFSPDDMTHIISSVSTAVLSVSAALVVMFILFYVLPFAP